MSEQALLAIIEALKDVGLVAAGAVATYQVTRRTAAAERKHADRQRLDERKYKQEQDARAGELALEGRIAERTWSYVLGVVEIAIAARSGNWEKADGLIARTSANPFDPNAAHLGLIYDPELRDRWDPVVIDTQNAVLERQAGQDTRGDADRIDELVRLGADLLVLAHDQQRRLARGEFPLRLEETPERGAKRAAMAFAAGEQMRTYIEAGALGTSVSSQRGDE